jgi:predicted component of type VI protein secretion system
VYWLSYQGARIAIRRGETVIGRSPYCSVVINSRRVSRQHCALTLSNDRLLVCDLGSSNGTWVNGTPVSTATRLKQGDLIELGEEGLEVVCSPAPRPKEFRDTERDLPCYHREPDSAAEQTTVTRTTTSVALIESLVANGSGTRSPGNHFDKVRRAVEKYLNGDNRIATASARLELERLKRSVEATFRLDNSSEASDWRRRVLAQLGDGTASETRPER